MSKKLKSNCNGKNELVSTASKLRLNQPGEGSRKVSNPIRRRLYTLKEAAEYLGRSEWGVRELIWAGKIPVVRVEGGRKIFLDIEDLNDFIKQNKSTYL